MFMVFPQLLTCMLNAQVGVRYFCVGTNEMNDEYCKLMSDGMLSFMVANWQGKTAT